MIFSRRVACVFALLMLIAVSACVLFFCDKPVIKCFKNNGSYWNWLETPPEELQSFDYVGVVGCPSLSNALLRPYFDRTESGVSKGCHATVVLYPSALADLESGFLSNAKESRATHLATVQSSLALQKKLCMNPDVRFPMVYFRRNIESLEYAIVRVMEADCAMPITAEEVMEVLPDALFDVDIKSCSWACYGSKYFRGVKAFRDMIVIGIAINEWKRRQGRYPKSLADVKEVAHQKQFLEYDCRDGVWQLFCPDKRWVNNISPFNVYVPSITRDRSNPTDWPGSGSLWLSSDYSEKRRRLWRDRIINKDDETWRCRLVNGRLCR